LSLFKIFCETVTNDTIMKDLEASQQEAHKWGADNQVVFDRSKEEFVILHRSGGSGNDFRLLGPWIDNKLLMHTAVNKIMAKAKPKTRALLRTQAYYCTAQLIQQFKTHVWPLLESATGAVYHAAASTLHSLDQCQNSFVRSLGMSPETAFLDHNLMPLNTRRDIAMLGFLHNCARASAHTSLCGLFPLAPAGPTHHHATRLQTHRHSYQLVDRCQGRQSEMLARSVFGLVRVYNLLPQSLVDEQDVSRFQKMLTKTVRAECEIKAPRWIYIYSVRG